MQKKRRLWVAIPFLFLPLVLALSLPSCSTHDGAAPGPQRLGEAVQRGGSCPTIPQALDGGSTCPTLDEFVPIDTLVAGSGWTSLSCDAGTCDITVSLQTAINNLAATANALFQTGDAGPNPATVLHLKGGNYTISDTIDIQGTYGITIVGDGAASTTITWNGGGAVDKPMFRVFDAQSVKIARLTLDGGLTGAPPPPTDGGAPAALAGVQVAESYGVRPTLPDGGPESFYNVYYIELDDLIFENLTHGLMVGAIPSLPVPFTESGWDQASSSVRRSQFQNIFTAGATIIPQNSFQWLFEDNVFLDCPTGIQELYPSIGSSFVIVNNLFFNDNGSATSNNVNVIKSGPTPDVVRGNVSLGADRFYYDPGDSDSQTEISGNYIALSPSTQYCSAIWANSRYTTLFDNYIQGNTTLDGGPYCTHVDLQPWNQTYCAIMSGGTDSDVHVMHGYNSYTGTGSHFLCRTPAEQCLGGTQCGVMNGSYVDDTSSNADTFGGGSLGVSVPAAAAQAYANWGSPPLSTPISCFAPPFAPAKTRTVKNVATTWSSTCTGSPPVAGCAQNINNWLGDAGAGPIMLYFPTGSYNVDGEIKIPPNQDVVIAGDGRLSELYWTGASGTDQYLLHARAPSQAMVRDLSLKVLERPDSGAPPGGFRVDSTDDLGGFVYLDMIEIGGVKSGFEMAGLDNVLVRTEQAGAGAERTYTVIGGGRASGASGTSASTQTQGFVSLSGDGAATESMITLKNWGKLTMIAADFEGYNVGPLLDQSGYLTFGPTRYYIFSEQAAYRSFYPFHANTLVESSFRGSITFTNVTGTTDILAPNAPQAQILVLGDAYGPGYPWTNAQPPASSGPPGEPCSTDPFALQDCSHITSFSAAAGSATQMALSSMVACAGSANIPACADVTNNPAISPSAFAGSMITDLRNVVNGVPVAPLTCGQTAVRAHNLGVYGVWVGSPQPTPPTKLLRTAIRVQRSN